MGRAEQAAAERKGWLAAEHSVPIAERKGWPAAERSRRQQSRRGHQHRSNLAAAVENVQAKAANSVATWRGFSGELQLPRSMCAGRPSVALSAVVERRFDRFNTPHRAREFSGRRKVGVEILKPAR